MLDTRKDVKFQEKREKEKRVQKISEEVMKQQMRARELDDNIKLMEKEKEIKDIERKMKEFKKSLSQYDDYTDFQQNRTNLQEKIDKSREKKALAQGRLKGFEEEVRRCQRELSKFKFFYLN